MRADGRTRDVQLGNLPSDWKYRTYAFQDAESRPLGTMENQRLAISAWLNAVIAVTIFGKERRAVKQAARWLSGYQMYGIRDTQKAGAKTPSIT
jgi:hypothetical protein